MMYELAIEDHFSAAHNLRNYNGNCEQLHGHNYKVQAIIQTDKLDTIGLGFDFRELRTILKETMSLLDHKYLNDLKAFQVNNPSTENIARFIYMDLKEKLEKYKNIQLKKITCCEEHDSSAAYYE